MRKTIDLSVRQIVLIACLLTAGSAGLTSVAQWRYDLLDRAEIKIVGMLSPEKETILQPTVSTIPSLPTAFQEPGIVLNTLAVQSPLPTEVDLALDPADDQKFLRSILDTIFPDGTAGLTEEQISIEILRYVSTTLRLESNSGTATKILKDGHAICGGMSISFQTLVRTAGLPARYIGIFGVVNQGSHALAEVYYDGQWHLFDPTYGMFFYSKPDYDHTGHIASLTEVLATATENWYLLKAIDRPWLGQYDSNIRSFGILEVEEGYLDDFYGYSFIDAYRQMFAETFPVAYVNNQILSFPVEIDFSTVDTFSVGTLDHDDRDIINATAMLETAGKTGSYYLGGGSLEEVHTWFIKAPSAGYVRLIYYSTDAEPPALLLFPLKAVYVVDSVQEGNKAEFLLRISDPDASLQLWTESGIYWIDAIQAEWLGASADIGRQLNP
ncbi:MAG: transglutaminase-like domain-containing protein [Chloroflexota bacterium]